MKELLNGSALKLAAAIRDKEISSKDVVDAYLKRIDEVNPKLNAVVALCPEKAYEQAREADEALIRGELLGPLHGVPMTLKDSFDSKGVISTGGTVGRTNHVPSEDSTVMARLRGAGAVLLGKTNTPELTLSYETDNLIYGRTSNPYKAECSSGGSSGGAAAIVAAGGAAFDIGSDYGGSLRYPAHCCGIATIKPTSGRVPRTGHILPFGGMLDSFQQVGPMARYVEDLNLILPVISGPDWIDPSIVPMPLGRSGAVDVKNLRVAFFTDNGIVSPSVETAEAARKAAAVLAGAGANVEEIKPGCIDQSYELMMGLLAADGAASTRRLLKDAGTEKHTLPFLDFAQPVDATQLDALMVKWTGFRSDMLGFIKNYDVILCPVNAYPALHHGSIRDDLGAFSYGMTFNLTGWPVSVVRAGASDDGLPIGVQIAAQPWREDVSLAAAEHLERELGGFQSPAI